MSTLCTIRKPFIWHPDVIPSALCEGEGESGSSEDEAD